MEKTSAKVNDPDNSAWTEDMLGAPVLKRGRGPQAAATKVLTSIRLDADVVAYFKSQGVGYPSRINEALRKELTRQFKFSIVYLIRLNEVVVIAVAPHKRKPGYWRSRVSAASLPSSGRTYTGMSEE